MDIIIREIKNRAELNAALAIREEVFVRELKIFPHSDQDENDTRAIHLIGLVEGKIVGTVRLYPDGSGVWIGGRLAVERAHRKELGKRLVREAMRRAKVLNCDRFIAYVQLSRVKYFQRLNWRPRGKPIPYCGLPHQLMEANLKPKSTCLPLGTANKT